jgi:hypothetical protein
MIKFFRKIRQKLISENRLSKYLLYAIGEIILVVIGILIALQINNWNEARKFRKTEIQIYREIKSELAETLLDVSEDLKDYERNRRSTIIVRNIILNKYDYQDSIKRHIPLLYDVEMFTPKTSAFESLKSIGLENLQNDSVRQSITNLYQITFPSLMESGNEKIRSHFLAINKIEPLIEKHLILDNRAILSNPIFTTSSTRTFPYLFIDYQSFLTDEKIGLAIQKSIRWRNAIIEQHKFVIMEIERISQMIDSELDRLT